MNLLDRDAHEKKADDTTRRTSICSTAEKRSSYFTHS